ncbi:MAG TPA: glycosyltransferase family 4 protein [Pyrinomonadaceae bacterium]|nr:glycosyltransferase family 4 protein [Pyrinomonadaceae bacterium]
MNILQISSAQSLGGGERHLVDLSKGLARRGHEIYLAARPESPLIRELNEIPRERVATFPLRNSLDAPSARSLAKLVRQHQIQVVHAHMARDYPLAAYAVRKNDHSRLVVTRHVLFPLNKLHRATLSRASTVIAVSEAVAVQLRNDKVVPDEKIKVVVNGIDTARFLKAREAFDREEFLKQWSLPGDSLLVGTVGELTPLKGQAEFIKAAVQVGQEFPNACFIVAGTDNSAEQTNSAALQELISRLKFSERVRVVPWLDEIAQLYCALDVFVSASHTESFGLAMAEAMASRTAVVATGTAGAREIIRPGETGLIVPIGDADELADTLIDLLGSADRRTRLGEAAQLDVTSRFGMEPMIDATAKIYLDAIQK